MSSSLLAWCKVEVISISSMRRFRIPRATKTKARSSSKRETSISAASACRSYEPL